MGRNVDEVLRVLDALQTGELYAWGKRNVKRLPLERVIPHTYPIDRTSEAFRQADWLAQGGDPLRISRAAMAC